MTMVQGSSEVIIFPSACLYQWHWTQELVHGHRSLPLAWRIGRSRSPSMSPHIRELDRDCDGEPGCETRSRLEISFRPGKLAQALNPSEIPGPGSSRLIWNPDNLPRAVYTPTTPTKRPTLAHILRQQHQTSTFSYATRHMLEEYILKRPVRCLCSASWTFLGKVASPS